MKTVAVFFTGGTIAMREDKDGAVFRLVLPLEKEALPGRLSAAGAVDGGEAAE